jgi:hypothetical protein
VWVQNAVLGLTGYVCKDGYGRFWTGYKKHNALSHRCYYEHVHGPLDPLQLLDHKCRNRACCNPDHLEPVSNQVNVLRGYSARRAEEMRRNGQAVLLEVE